MLTNVEDRPENEDHARLGISGLKLLTPFYWKPFWDVNVMFILSNWNDIHHFHC